MTEFTFISFACAILAVGYGTASLYQPARLWAMTGVGRLCVIVVVLALLPGKMRAIFIKRGIFHIIRDCMLDLLSAILAFARAGKID